MRVGLEDGRKQGGGAKRISSTIDGIDVPLKHFRFYRTAALTGSLFSESIDSYYSHTQTQSGRPGFILDSRKGTDRS